MAAKNVFEAFKDPELSGKLLEKLESTLTGQVRFMEVCGTHTVSIFQSGLNDLLPDRITHLSGPGCPVCVTHDSEVAAYLKLADNPAVTIATFGDLMRVPGPEGGNLKIAKSKGASVEVVYSVMDALELARKNPGREVVFLGIGFETTAPTTAAALTVAKAEGLKNFSVMSFHKLVPRALTALAGDPEINVDAFILPGHVSIIIGEEPYRFLAEKHRVPSVIAGFDPLDILAALVEIAAQRAKGEAKLVNAYTRVVGAEGNPKAQALLKEVFTPFDAPWRGIGVIPGSGLKLNEAYVDFDAFKRFGLALDKTRPLPGCRCGDVLKAKIRPNECPLFGKACTPANPIGPCMVSSEGSCAAYYRFSL